MSRLGPFEENTIVVGDCLDIMAQMPDGCFKLIFLDPPFNAAKNYGVLVDDNKPRTAYLSWMERLILEASRLVEDGGTLWIMNDTRWIGHCQVMLDGAGLDFQNLIVWPYTNPTPAQKRFPKTWRPILFYGRGKPQTFNDDDIELGRPTLYYNPSRAVTRPVHDIWPDIPKLVGGFLSPPELLTQEDGRFAHLAQMPEGIAERIIRVATDEGDVVGDFVIGSGTTAVVADRLGRKFFGCDINPDYVEMALERLEKDRAARQLELAL